MSELADLLARLVASDQVQKERLATQEERFAAQQQLISDQQGQIAALLQNIKESGTINVEVKPPPPEAAVVRAEKIQKIASTIRRSTRVKPFKVSSEIDVKLFLKRFEEELQSMKLMVGLAANLTRDEYVPIFRSCLEFPVKERVDQVLLTLNKTWKKLKKMIYLSL